MEYFYLTDPGKVRDHNEDSVLVVKNKNDEILMIVADGMGGHRGGEIAANIVVSQIGKRFESMGSIGDKEDTMNWFKEIVSEANSAIYKYTNEHKESTGMGTTLVMAIYTKKFLIFGNIGDSSGYVIRNNRLHKITEDHTLVNLLFKSGKLTKEEAQEHPRKNILMRALGTNTQVEMDIFDVDDEIQGIMLCSDGLTNMLDDETIEKVINEKKPIDEKLQKLIQKSNNRGGNDNISVALLDVRGEK